MPRTCEDLARDIYNFFKSSSKRICQYKEFQDFCDISPHKILRPAQTRWLSLDLVVNRIVEQWPALKLFFASNWLTDKLKASENIFHALHDPSILIYYKFLQWVLPKFINLNKLFQSDKPLICLVHNKMTTTYTDILYSYMRRCHNPLSIDPADSSYFLPLNQMYLGAEVLTMLQAPDVTRNEIMVKDILERCRAFLIISVKEIKARFDFNNPVLMQLEKIIPKNVLSDKRPTSLIHLINLFPRVNPNIQNIDNSWRMLDIIEFEPEMKKLLLDLNVEDFWIKLKDFEKDDEYPFKDVADFLLIILSLPQSNVSCERIFSKINLIKTKQRNCLNTSTLNGILCASAFTKHTECHQVTISESMLNMFNSNMYDHVNNEIENVEFINV